MREIKFRAWDGLEFYNPILSEGLIFRNYRDFEDFDHADDVLMQYTGLKDKNGKEIYEGDVIYAFSNGYKYTIEFGIISVDVENHLTTPAWYAKLIGDTYKCPLCSTEIIEVIGNIYENPELLGPDESTVYGNDCQGGQCEG